MLLTECVPSKYVSLAGTLLVVWDSAISYWLTLYFRYISTHGPYIFWFALLINTAVLIVTFWIPESPKWLAANGQIGEAKRSLRKIAKYNGVKDFVLESLDTEITSKSSPVGISESQQI